MSKFYLGNNKASKLSPDQVYEIRQRWANRFVVPVTMRQMAYEYGVSPNTISNAVNELSHRGVATVESAADANYRQQLMNDRLKASLARPAEAIDPQVTQAFERLEPEDTTMPDDPEARLRWIQEQAERLRPIREAREAAEKATAEAEAERLRKVQEQMAEAQAALPTALPPTPAQPTSQPSSSQAPKYNAEQHAADLRALLRKCQCKLHRLPPGRDFVLDEGTIHRQDKCEPQTEETRTDDSQASKGDTGLPEGSNEGS
jgi:hypothetical protein